MDEDDQEYQFWIAYELFAERRRIRGPAESEILEYLRLSQLWVEAGHPEDMDKFISDNANSIL